MEANNKRNSLLHSSISKKIIGLLAVAMLLCFIAVGFFIIPMSIDILNQSQIQKMSMMAETIVADIRHHMLEGEADSIYSVIKEFDSVKNIQKIEILKTDGRAAFRDTSTIERVNRRLGKVVFQRDEKPEEMIISPDDTSLQRLLKTNSSVSFLSGDSESRTLLFPLLNEDACYKCHGSGEKVRGILFIKRATSQTKKNIAAIEYRLFIGFFTTLLVVTLFLWFAIKRMVITPINRIAKNARLITKEGLQLSRMEINSKDEIGELARNFNQMITALNENYHKIKDTEQFLRSILESMGGGISVLDREFRVLLTNRTVLDLMKMESKDIIGKHCYRVFHKLDDVCPDCAVARTFETGKPDFTQHSASASDGSIIHAELHSYPIADSEGNVVKVIEMVSDVTARIKMEEQLRRHEKLAAVGMLASGVAHEVGNPLASIYALSQVIERKTNEPSTKGNIELMTIQIERIIKIIQDFLDLQKPHALNLEYVNLSDVIESSLKLVSYDKRVDKLNIETRLEDSLPQIYAAPDGLHQVFINLIFNAADAVQDNKNGQLIISASRNNGFVTVAFKDNGKGIGVDEREKLFEPFFTTKGVGKGTGLGLFVSYGIIKSFGGDIEVESEKGKGTNFKLHLPAAKDKG